MNAIVGDPERVSVVQFADSPPVLHVPFGTAVIKAGRGDALAVNRLYSPNGNATILFALGSIGANAAIFIALPPASARELAASILTVCDRADQGKGKQ